MMVSYCTATARRSSFDLHAALRRFFSALFLFSYAEPAVSADDREALNIRAEHLLDVHGNSILRLAYSYTHNMSDAEEILQETLIRFIKAAPSFESGAHEKAWLLKVASNLSKNRISYNKIRETDELSETLAGKDEEDLSFVWEAVKALPEKYREVLHLFYFEGYHTAEIADLLGERETTVRTHLLRARNQLKTVLKEAYDFE